jgi:predicted dehydrogenase
VHHRACQQLEAEGLLQVVATCDPDPSAFGTLDAELRFADRKTRFFPDLDRLLDACAGELDWVILPTPVPLHAPMHRACRERGLAVYLEKPPTLDLREMEDMIRVDAMDARATNVGFNYILQPEPRALKRRILDGEFGALREVRLMAAWGRAESYFTRNNWAGRRCTPDGRDLLDSCFSNAMAHLVMDVLCWAGTSGLDDFAEAEVVEAKLFRAHDIETMDTVFASCAVPGGPSLRFALTHACAPMHLQREEVHCERAVIHFDFSGRASIHRPDTPPEIISLAQFRPCIENLRAYAAYLEGRLPRPVVRLEDSLPFVRLNRGLHDRCPEVTPLPADRVTRLEDPQGRGVFRVLDNAPAVLEHYLRTNEINFALSS